MGGSIRIPVFFFLGRHDHVVDQPPFEELAKFLQAMNALVQPVAARTARAIL